MMDTAGKKSGGARLLWYGLAALLLAAYLVILYNGLHPGDRMRSVYRALYIDHTFSQTDLAYYAVTPDEPLHFTPDTHAGDLLGAGQWQMMPTGGCLTGSEGLLWVRRPAAGPLNVEFTLCAAQQEPLPVVIELNGEIAAEADAAQAPQTVTVRLPEGEEGELLQFTFRIPAEMAGTLIVTEMTLC